MNKTKNKLFLYILCLLLFAGGEAFASQQTVSWFERGVEKKAVFSGGEAVLIGKKGRRNATRNSELLKKLHPKASIKKTEGAAHYIQAPEALQWQQVKQDPGLGNIKPVFYKNGLKTPGNRMVLMGEVIVRYPSAFSDKNIRDIEKEYGLTRIKTPSIKRNVFIYQAENPFTGLEQANRLAASGRVVYATPNWLRSREKRATPDDPLFLNQWHLENTGQGSGLEGADINVVSAWDRFRGSSEEVIAIVDDGLEIAHEDLEGNIAAGLSYDFVDEDEDPSPGYYSDKHGTACAGAAAARGFNAIGVTGSAPYAGLAGFRLLGAGTDANEAGALSRHMDVIDIYSNSWGPRDGGSTIEGPGPLTRDALEDGIINGRGGLGCIYVWAGGNGYDADNANYDGYTNCRYTIAVAASTNLGSRAAYSEKGACILINVPSDGGTLDITTTDRSGNSGYRYGSDYTDDFGGTSAAAPIASGIVALMLQANPQLSWRDVQHILIHTAVKNDPADEDWTLNGAGFPVNHKYGFGRADAAAAVTAAQTWPTAMPELSIEYSSAPSLSIPDNFSEGVTDAISVTESIEVEFVDIRFSSDHTKWGNLEIVLESPDGTQSILAEEHSNGYGSNYSNWRFGSARHYGEDSQGNWRLTVKDLASGYTGVLNEWTLVIYGTKPGNINGDKDVDLKDAILGLKIVADTDAGTEDIYRSADVDGDGRIGLGEVVFILREVGGFHE